MPSLQPAHVRSWALSPHAGRPGGCRLSGSGFNRSARRRWGHDIGFGIGIAHGFATLGTIGFEGRFDYAAIGTVSSVASRLCDEAKPGQILINPRVLTKVENAVKVEPVVSSRSRVSGVLLQRTTFWPPYQRSLKRCYWLMLDCLFQEGSLYEQSSIPGAQNTWRKRAYGWSRQLP